MIARSIFSTIWDLDVRPSTPDSVLLHQSEHGFLEKHHELKSIVGCESWIRIGDAGDSGSVETCDSLLN
jgi:hypothetical protein